MSTKDPAALRAEFYNLPDDAMVDRHTVGAVLYASASTLEAEAGKGTIPLDKAKGLTYLLSQVATVLRAEAASESDLAALLQQVRERLGRLG